MTDRRVPGPVGDLHVDDGGAGGEPVLFLHSLAGNTTHWEHQLAHCRRTRRAVAMDLRGHGRSETSDDAQYTLDAYAEDVAAVAEALDLGRCTLVGHSLGAGAAIAFADAHPGRAARLLLVDPVGDQRLAPPGQMAAFLASLTENYRDTIEQYWRVILGNARGETETRVLKDLELTPRRVVIESLRKLAAFDLSAALTRFAGPSLSVVTPLNDVPYSLHRLVEELPVTRIDGTSHWLQLDRSSDYNRILDGFLAD